MQTSGAGAYFAVPIKEETYGPQLARSEVLDLMQGAGTYNLLEA
jgi:hypothetical protein